MLMRLAFALYIVLPALCVAATPMSLRRSERFVFGVALYEFLIVAVGLMLGSVRALTPTAYCSVMTVICLALCGAVIVEARRGLRRKALPLKARRWLMTRRGVFMGCLAAVIAVIFSAQVAIDALVGSLHWDGIWYHLPRVIAWSRQGHFDVWPGARWPELAHPVAADLALGSKILFGLSVHGVAYVTLLFTAAATVAVYAIGRELRLSRWRAGLAAMLFASFPVVGNRVATSSSDIAAALPIMAGYLAFARMRRADRGWAAFIVLSALGVACKLTVAPLVAVLVAAVWYRRPDVISVPVLRKPAVAAAVFAGVLLFGASVRPVYEAYNDITGGEIGRGHAVATADDVATALSAHTLHWLAEPLGYVQVAEILSGVSLPPYVPTVNAAYRAVGIDAQQIPRWAPDLAPDSLATGALLAIFVPVAFLALPRWRTRIVATFLWTAAYVTLFGVIRAQPYAGRFGVVLFGALAIAWAAGRLARTKLFMAVVALNVVLMVPALWSATAVGLIWRTSGGPLFQLAADGRVTDLQSPPEWLLHAIVPGRQAP